MEDNISLEELVSKLSNPQNQAQAIIELADLSEKDSWKAKIAEYPGLIDKLAIHSDSGYSKTKENAVKTLTNLATVESNKPIMGKCDKLLEVIVAIVKVEVLEVLEGAQTKTQRKACRLLASLAMSHENQERMCNFPELLLSLVCTLERSDEKCYEQTTRCLLNLALCPQNRLTISKFVYQEKPLISYLVQLLTTLKSTKAQEYIAKALANLTITPEIQSFAAQQPNLLEQLVKVITSDDNIQAQCSLILAHVSSNIDSHTKLIDIGIIQTTLDLFKSRSESLSPRLLLVCLFHISLERKFRRQLLSHKIIDHFSQMIVSSSSSTSTSTSASSSSSNDQIEANFLFSSIISNISCESIHSQYLAEQFYLFPKYLELVINSGRKGVDSEVGGKTWNLRELLTILFYVSVNDKSKNIIFSDYSANSAKIWIDLLFRLQRNVYENNNEITENNNNNNNSENNNSENNNSENSNSENNNNNNENNNENNNNNNNNLNTTNDDCIVGFEDLRLISQTLLHLSFDDNAFIQLKKIVGFELNLNKLINEKESEINFPASCLSWRLINYKPTLTISDQTIPTTTTTTTPTTTTTTTTTATPPTTTATPPTKPVPPAPTTTTTTTTTTSKPTLPAVKTALQQEILKWENIGKPSPPSSPKPKSTPLPTPPPLPSTPTLNTTTTTTSNSSSSSSSSSATSATSAVASVASFASSILSLSNPIGPIKSYSKSPRNSPGLAVVNNEKDREKDTYIYLCFENSHQKFRDKVESELLLHSYTVWAPIQSQNTNQNKGKSAEINSLSVPELVNVIKESTVVVVDYSVEAEDDATIRFQLDIAISLNKRIIAISKDPPKPKPNKKENENNNNNNNKKENNDKSIKIEEIKNYDHFPLLWESSYFDAQDLLNVGDKSDIGAALEEKIGNVCKRKTKLSPNLIDSHRNVQKEKIETFNQNAKQGVEEAIKVGLISADAKDIAKFLHETQGLSQKSIGEYIGGSDDKRKEVLKEFTNLFSFTSLSIDEGLRVYLSSFALPGEAQIIDRIIEQFSRRFVECNPNETLKDPTTANVLAFSIIMLNTDLHNPLVKKKMTKEEFIRNNRGICNGQDLPPELLNQIYDRVKADELKFTEDKGSEKRPLLFYQASHHGWLKKEGGTRKTVKRRWFRLTDHCLFYFDGPQMDATVIGAVPLSGVAVRQLDTKQGKTDFGFELVPLSQGEKIKSSKLQNNKMVMGTHDSFVMYAESEEERSAWMVHIIKSIVSDSNKSSSSEIAKSHSLPVQKSNTASSLPSSSPTSSLNLSYEISSASGLGLAALAESVAAAAAEKTRSESSNLNNLINNGTTQNSNSNNNNNNSNNNNNNEDSDDSDNERGSGGLNVQKMTENDVCQWLQKEGFGNYQNAFKEQKINGQALVFLANSSGSQTVVVHDILEKKIKMDSEKVPLFLAALNRLLG